MELKYLADTTPAKMLHFRRFAQLGLVLFNAFLATDRLMMPDVFILALVLQLALVTPAALISIIVAGKRPELVDSVAAACFLLMLASTIVLFEQSHVAGALLLPFTFPLILMSGNMMVPLRFSVAIPFTAAGGVAIVVAILSHAGYRNEDRWFTLLIVLGMSVYSLFVTFRLELSTRSTYLLAQREIVRSEALTRHNEDLRNLSDTDALTGIGNRRFFDTTLERLWREAIELDQSVGLLLIDIDHFKQLNDQHGHLTGDRCLLLLANLLRDFTRNGQGHAARYGGEEFAILLPGESLHAAQNVAERVRGAVEVLTARLGDTVESGAIRISIGCASIIPNGLLSTKELIGAADAALYQAKRLGRNRVHPPVPLESVSASHRGSLAHLPMI